MSKNFIVFIVFFIASCGGGSGSVTTNNSNSFVNPVINDFSSNKYNLDNFILAMPYQISSSLFNDNAITSPIFSISRKILLSILSKFENEKFVFLK